MTFMTRSATLLVTSRHVTQIPKKGFEYLKEWLGTTGLPVYETALSLGWDYALNEIRSNNTSMFGLESLFRDFVIWLFYFLF
jgi:nucleosome binding factor SPN SPT16 subunit